VLPMCRLPLLRWPQLHPGGCAPRSERAATATSL